MTRLANRLVAACVAATLVACSGSDSPTAPNPQPTSVASVALSTTTVQVAVGATAPITATPRDAAGNALAGRAVAWSTSNAAVARVENGVVTGVAAGTAKIRATSEGKQAEADVTVTAAQVPVASLAIGTALDTLEAYETRQLAATLRDAEGNVLAGRAVQWASSDPAVATVDPATGVLTGVDRGTVTITATSEGKQATASRVVVIRYRSITAGTGHACNIASGGIAWCWGVNGREGRIGGTEMVDGTFSAVPVRVPGDHRFVQLSTFGRATCGVTREARLACWGYNGWGMLGITSNTLASRTPVELGAGRTWRSVSVGAEHVCAVTTTNQAFCWGYNSSATLGTGDRTTSLQPVEVSGNHQWALVAAGNDLTCGVTTNGDAYCWGASTLGSLGDGLPISGGTTFALVPQPVVGGVKFAALSASSQHVCGVGTDGRGRCWGSNGGRVGNGTSHEYSSPTEVSGNHTFRSIASGFSHVCGVTTGDALFCWGSNGYGQLGVAGIAHAATPTRAAGGLLVAEVSAANIATGSAGYTCAISKDRLTTRCWGRNDAGQLGNGTTTPAQTPNAEPTVVVGQRAVE